ncbi:conserved domain protein [Burkholderia pseudomallei MSHR346]|nr:conserved domain protein [Burkholderia pseudomallei MSHR346]
MNPTDIKEPVPTRTGEVTPDAVSARAAAARTCLSCGAKTDADGALPCGH